MESHLDRAELISHLLGDLLPAGESTESERLLGVFARAVLRRVDDGYLFRHRMTTLGAQLRESFSWFATAASARDVRTRAFDPAEATHGYTLDGHVVETLMPDQPFIYDTLKLFMEFSGIRVLNSLHIILPIRLADDGRLEAINAGADGVDNVSYTRWYVDFGDAWNGDSVAAEIARRLRLARQMVEDFRQMSRDVKGLVNEFDYLSALAGAPEASCAEVRDFLAWLVRENFVFMGMSTYRREADGSYGVDAARGLGIARDTETPSGGDTAETLAFLASQTELRSPLVRVRKSSEDSVLHRRGKVDEVLIRTFDDAGVAIGGVAAHGMFTYKGLSESGGDVPILRRKLARILEHEGTIRSSYEHKSMVHAFNALPVEYLFEADDETVRDLIQMSIKASYTQEIRAHIVAQPDAKSAYVFVVLPKEDYSDDLRATLQELLKKRLDASYADHRVHLGKYNAVALHFYLTGVPDIARCDLGAVEARVVELGTPWTARLRRALFARFGESRGLERFERYAEAFGEGYADLTSPTEAVIDIEHLDQLSVSGEMRFDLLPHAGRPTEALLRIYSTKDLLLTDVLPVVDNFGVTVAEQYAFEANPAGADHGLYVNTLRIRRGDPDVLEQRVELLDALAAVFARRMRSDRINRVLLPGRITWREVDVVRAYFQYSRQLGSQLTPEIVQKTLITHRAYVHDLFELFRARFDPDAALNGRGRADREADLVKHLTAYLDGVAGFEEDRILRTFLNLVQATIRTNLYREQPDGAHYVSFKLQCDRVTDMPSPRPMYEIYVHHARVEGVHLRAGKVARGGLRWSDRLDDYRSEVLGLMATQVLKNTVIVPTGAKGGFVLKTPPDDWSEARRQADELYQIFIRGLLDITDNVVDGAIVPPPRVLRYDDDDAYLVVAADKGTAHLSDTANALARRYGFWLDDAFASGGSVGYDHKEKGITARGAWVCARRHFLELGVDPERDVITAVGIGDMSGDVFGNGLLSSRTIALVGAFDHRHIFIDPNPDPATSFAERERLFAMPRSAWTDYNPALISRGGGVYERGAKSIHLSDEARARFGTELVEVSGEGLIRLILLADVDLLWNGGIGTYIKSVSESDADVADVSNDRVRVDAAALRCRVIGEGGNLGVTMRGRVEFATAGGRINLDAIDNSGGVDLSDHEVNIKTLLNPVVARGEMARSERDALLIAAGDGVCDAVLDNNHTQSLGISLDERRSHHDIWSFVHAMLFLRERVGFSRRVARLPRGNDAIALRVSHNKGFLRPELAKLLSYSKMHVRTGLAARPIGDAAALRPFLVSYFPEAIVAAHGDTLVDHLLFHDIAATVQTNRVVDMAGVTLYPSLAVATERHPSDITAAYLILDELFGLRGFRTSLLEAEAAHGTEQTYDALIAVEDHLARATRNLLWTWPDPIDLGTAGALAPLADAARVLDERLEQLIPDRARRVVRDRVHELTSHGLDAATARRVATLPWMDHTVPICRIALDLGLPVDDVAAAYFTVGTGTWIFDLMEAAGRQSYPDRWDNIAVHSIVRSLLSNVGRLARARLKATTGRKKAATGRWLSQHDLSDTATQIGELLRERIPVSAMLVLSERLKLRVDTLTGQTP